MKTLVIQSNGEHEENKNFRECFSLQRAFKKFEDGMKNMRKLLVNENIYLRAT